MVLGEHPLDFAGGGESVPESWRKGWMIDGTWPLIPPKKVNPRTFLSRQRKRYMLSRNTQWVSAITTDHHVKKEAMSKRRPHDPEPPQPQSSTAAGLVRCTACGVDFFSPDELVCRRSQANLSAMESATGKSGFLPERPISFYKNIEEGKKGKQKKGIAWGTAKGN